METENHEFRDNLIITPSGLVGSLRTKKDSIDDTEVLFGYKDQEEDKVILNKLFYIFNIIILIFIERGN